MGCFAVEEAVVSEKLTFDELGLSEESLAGIRRKGFEEPTAIQAMTIPVMLRGEANVIAVAQTGTGKTAAFGLPLIEMIDADQLKVQALVLVPTRELAIQVSEEINSLKGGKNIRTVPIYGGQSIDQQLRRLKSGVQIVVGSPGRVIDHLNRGTLNLGEIEHLVLDEADEMLNMGFIDDMEEIFKHTNPEKKTLLFSATMPEKIKRLAKKYMDGYELLRANKDQLTTNLTEQIYFEVKARDKFGALCRIIDIEDTFYGLVFCRTRADVDSVASQLVDRGYDAEPIHGEISQQQRERTLNAFRKKRINVLVATDVAARGIDVINLTHVINYSLPWDPESYVHRIGRTGRAGNEGTAITFITPNEYRRLMTIQRAAKVEIKRSQVPKVKDIVKAKKRKIDYQLIDSLETEIDPSFTKWANWLVDQKEPGEVVAAILQHCFKNEIDVGTYGALDDRGERMKHGSRVDEQGCSRLFVAMGKRDKINPRALVELIQSRVRIESREISDIEVLDKFSFVTVPFAYAEEVLKSFKVRGRKPLITRARK